MKTIRNFAALATLGLFSFAPAAHAVRINVNTTVNYAINSDLNVGDGTHSPTVNLVAGSSVNGLVGVYGNSTLNISGGTIVAGIFPQDNSVINFFGTGLSSNFLFDLGDGDNAYTISGTLSDGTVLRDKQLVTSGAATFTLNNAAATPEPGSIALLVGMGVTGFGVLRRRRK